MNKNYLQVLALMSFLLVIGANTSFAQIKFGVKGGIDVVKEKMSSDVLNVKNRLGYQIGPTVELIVPASGFGGEISILYGRKEYKLQDKKIDASISDYNYISIPVNIKQRIKLLPSLGLFFTGGVYGNVKVDGGNLKLKDISNEYKAKNFVFGLNAGAGVNLLGHIDVGFYFRGDLTDNYGKEYMDAGIFQDRKNQTWTVGLSYYF